MSWIDKDNNLLLRRSFMFGAAGIIFCVLRLINAYFQWTDIPMVPLYGLGLGLQLFGLSIAVMVLRKRKIAEDIKDRAKKMILVLAVALVFFVLVF